MQTFLIQILIHLYSSYFLVLSRLSFFLTKIYIIQIFYTNIILFIFQKKPTNKSNSFCFNSNLPTTAHSVQNL